MFVCLCVLLLNLSSLEIVTFGNFIPEEKPLVTLGCDIGVFADGVTMLPTGLSRLFPRNQRRV